MCACLADELCISLDNALPAKVDADFIQVVLNAFVWQKKRRGLREEGTDVISAAKEQRIRPEDSAVKHIIVCTNACLGSHGFEQGGIGSPGSMAVEIEPGMASKFIQRGLVV